MLQVFYGNDRAKVLEASNKVMSTLLKKHDLERIVVTEDTEDKLALVLSYASTDALFGGGAIVVIDQVFTDEVFESAFFKHLSQFVESPNQFIVREEKILKPELTKLQKAGAEVLLFEKTKEKKETFNVFALADALGRKDKKNLWVLFEKAKRAGIAPENIAGTLNWQLKTQLLVEAGAADGLHPFAVSKARSFLKNFKEGEVAKLSIALVGGYHEAHQGKFTLESFLERFILGL
jgi:hypothetical protein